MARRIRQVFISTGILLGLVVLLVIGVSFYLKTDHAQRLIQAKVNQAISGIITWEGGGFSLLGNNVELRNISVKGPTREKLMTMESLSVNISWAALLMGELAIETAMLHTPRVWLGTDAEGKLNVTRAFESSGAKKQEASKGGFPFNIAVRHLKIMNGFVSFEGDGEAKEERTDRAVLHNIELTVRDVNLMKRTGRVDLRIDKGEIHMAGIEAAVDEVRLYGALKEDRIDPLVLAVKTNGSTLEISGNVGSLFSDPLLDIVLQGEICLPEIQEILQAGTGLTGVVKTSLTVRGSVNNPEVALLLGYGGGNLAGNRIDGMDLSCHMEDRYLTIDPLSLYAPLGRLGLRGNVNLRKAFPQGFLSSRRNLDVIGYELSLRQKGTSLENVLSGGTEVTGAIHSKMTIEGQGVSPETVCAKAVVELIAEKLAVSRILFPADVRVETQIGLARGRVTIEGMKVQTGKTWLELAGNYDLSSQELAATVKLESPDLAETFSSAGLPDVHGKVSGGITLRGKRTSLLGTFALQGKDLRCGEFRVGDLDAQVRLAGGTVSLERVKLRNGSSALSISGTVQALDTTSGQILENPVLDMALTGDKLFIEDFFEGLKGELSLSCHVKGDAAEPKGKVSLLGKNIRIGDQEIDGVQLTSHIDGKRIHVDPFVVTVAEGEKIRVDGWVSLNNYDLQIASDGISIGRIYELQEHLPVEGKVFFHIAGQGSFQNPALQGVVGLRDLGLSNESLEVFQLQVNVKNQDVRICGKLPFDIEGRLQLQTRDFSVSALFHETDLAPYLKIAGRYELNGAITGKIRIEGNAGAPDQIRAKTDISQLDLFWEKTALVKARQFKVSLEDNKIFVPRVYLDLLEGGFLELKGGGKLAGPLDLEAKGCVPLQVINLLTYALPGVTGYINFSATMKGSVSEPDLLADIDLEKIGMIVPGLSQHLHDLRGKIHVTPEAVVLDNLKGLLDTGRFDLSGKVALEKFKPSKILVKLTARELPVIVPDNLEILLDATLDIHGTPDKSMVLGEVVILEGTYYRDVNLNLLQGIAQKKREVAPVPSQITQPFLKNMIFDVTVKHRDPFVVDNNLALLTVKPDLRLHGTLDNPLISGRTEVDSGTITYGKKEFEVTKGVFDFINPYKIEPTIDVKSEVNIRTWTIFLDVNGTPDNLKFTLTSDPPEHDEDILSLLIVGKTTRELIKGEGGSSLSTTEMFANILAGAMGEEIKDAIGLDIVELEYEEAVGEEEESDTIKVTVGEELSRRVTVKYGIETRSAKMIQRAIAEYKFLENLSMNTFRDTEGQFGGELQYRLEFR